MMRGQIAFVWRVVLIPLIAFELLAVLGVFAIDLDYTLLGLFLTSSTVLIGLEITYSQMQKRLQQTLCWWAVFPVLFTTVFDAAGDFLHWYSQYPLYDAALHFVGSFAAAAFLWNVFTASFQPQRDRALLVWSTFTTAVTLGVFYELEEYIEDMVTGGNRLGDGPDTANDLLLNVLGALTIVGLVVLFRIFKRRTKS